jgi:hypothetical protein
VSYEPKYLDEDAQKVFLETQLAKQFTDEEAAAYSQEKSLELIERAESYAHGYLGRYVLPITSATWVPVLKVHCGILYAWLAQAARFVESYDQAGLDKTFEWLEAVRKGDIVLYGAALVDLVDDADGVTSPNSLFRSHKPVFVEKFVRGV